MSWFSSESGTEMVATESQFVMALLWLSLVVNKENHWLLGKTMLKTGVWLSVLPFSPDMEHFVTSLLQVNICGSMEKTAFPGNLLALDKN